VDTLYIQAMSYLYEASISDIVAYASIDGLDPKKLINLIRVKVIEE